MIVNNKNMNRVLVCAAFFICSLVTSIAYASVQGIYDDRILLGQTAALKGPVQELGKGMRAGLNAAFKEANDSGGVHGRKIELKSYNDGYEPDDAIVNMEKLINEDKVFAVVGGVGTPTSKAAHPIAKAANVPFIGPFTGAGFLRDSENSNVVNVRGSYDQETEAWIEHLTTDLAAKKIAILYQDDSFGRAGLSGVEKALDKRGMKLAAEGTYPRNTIAVKSALLSIRRAKPDAVVMVGAYKPIAEFVKLANKLRFDSTFVTISFVGSKALAAKLGSLGEGLVITQVVPFYNNTEIPLVKSYLKALDAFSSGMEPGFVSLEGYMVGRLVVESLQSAGRDLSRAKLLSAIKNKGKFDLGGVQLTYGPTDNQGMDNVYLSVIQEDGSFQYVENLAE